MRPIIFGVTFSAIRSYGHNVLEYLLACYLLDLLVIFLSLE